MGQESGHSLAACLWRGPHEGVVKQLAGAVVSPEGEGLLPSSLRGCRQASVSHLGSPQVAPGSAADLPQDEGSKRGGDITQDGRCSLFHNLVSEVTSHHVRSILFPKSKSGSPDHTDGKKMSTGVRLFWLS